MIRVIVCLIAYDSAKIYIFLNLFVVESNKIMIEKKLLLGFLIHGYEWKALNGR